jgi:dihydroneopterin aldolase
MTAREKLTFNQLVMEFERLRQDTYALRVNYNLMAENVTSLLEMKKDFSIKGGFVERLAEVVINAIKDDMEDFKKNVTIKIETLPCQSLEDKTAFCRIAGEDKPLMENEKKL